jgi:hypothetical protein
MTAALVVFAATVALTAGGLTVIAALCLIRGWQTHRGGWRAVPHEQQEWADV